MILFGSVILILLLLADSFLPNVKLIVRSVISLTFALDELEVKPCTVPGKG